MYPLDLALPVLSKREWIAVLKLSNLWEMDEMVQLAMSKLEELQLTPCENILFGKAFKVPRWMNEGYKSLAKSELSSQFSLEELTGTLGWETTCRILWVREEATALRQAQLQRSSSSMGMGFWIPGHAIRCGTCHLDGVEQPISNLQHSCGQCDQLPSYSGVVMDRSARRKSRSSNPLLPDYWVGSDKLFCSTCHRNGYKTQLHSRKAKCTRCDSGPSSTILAWGLTLERPELKETEGDDEEERNQMISEKVSELVEAELEGVERFGQ